MVAEGQHGQVLALAGHRAAWGTGALNIQKSKLPTKQIRSKIQVAILRAQVFSQPFRVVRSCEEDSALAQQIILEPGIKE